MINSNTPYNIHEKNSGYYDESEGRASNVALSGIEARSCATLDILSDLSAFNTSPRFRTPLYGRSNSETISCTPSFSSKHKTNSLLQAP